MLVACDILRIEFQNDLDSEMIDITPKGQPKPSSGEKFIGITGTRWSPQITDQNRGLDEIYGFKVVVSFRSRAVPYDRHGRSLYVQAISNMESYCRRIMVKLHQNVDFFAKTDLITPGVDRLTEFPRWMGTDPEPRPVGPEWFHAMPEELEAGYVMEVRFDGARRIQTYENMV